MTYFASGSNNPVEIRGFAAIGHPIGVSAAHLSPRGEAALHDLAGSGLPVFVDSGAFSEVRFSSDAPPEVVRPMTASDWERVIGLYLRLAASLGSALYIVAPDCIGNQTESLRRLRRWSAHLQAIRKTGANIIVPIQRGPLPQSELDRKSAKALGFDDYIRGIPSKKKATSLADLTAFIRETKPARVHLLGMGLRNRQYDAFRRAATAFGAELTCDSNLLKASVGRTNGRANHPSERRGGRRVYTRAQDLAHAVIASGLSPERDARELAIPLAFARVDDEAARWGRIEHRLGLAEAAA